MKPETILITGAGRRIGKALALNLGAKGHPIAIHFRASEKEAAAVASEIKSKGGRAETFHADFANPLDLDSLIEKAAKTMGGPITVLVNNAASFEKDDLQTLTRESYLKNFSANLEGPLFLAKAFAANLPEGTPGNIINIIDQRVLNVTKDFLTYTLSKHALGALTKILALELAPQIRVNGICPGPTLKNAFQSDADFKAELLGIPLKRGPKLEEFSGAVEFILRTPSMTGQMITLDGGQHLG